ncbi:MAG: FAD-dependent oxidoreductase [Phycisphaerae bacterium]|nr:FAD-dependent oxidoreductase [Phycisphaerae bacterium]
MNNEKLRDCVIVGGGPAGFAAALYAARDRYDVLVLEKNGLSGGQILLTEKVENYPGYEQVGGPELMQTMQKQVENFGAEVAAGKAVTSLRAEDDVLVVEINDGDEIVRARAVILAPGSDYRTLGVPGEDDMRQATRVSYCATCDGAFYRDMHVLAVGGGNTAVEDSTYLATRFVKNLTLVHRRREFRAQKVLVEELYNAADEHDIDIKLPYVLERIVPADGGEQIDHVVLRNVETDQTEDLKVDGVFIFVGMVPNTGWLRGAVDMDDNGYIAADPITMKTSMPGVFVVGDCRQAAALQLATATSDGVIAAMQLKHYFRDPSTWQSETTAEGTGW